MESTPFEIISKLDEGKTFDEVKVGKETYEYTFSCDGIEFVIDALISLKDNDLRPFSQSQYVFK